MKIELIKKTKFDGEIWDITKIDGNTDNCYLMEDDAMKRYNSLLANAKTPPVIEVLKSTEI